MLTIVLLIGVLFALALAYVGLRLLLTPLAIVPEPFRHPHTREIARRSRQLARGIIHTN